MSRKGKAIYGVFLHGVDDCEGDVRRLILFTAIVVSFIAQNSYAAWLSGYTYRTPITVTGSTAGAQTNYPLKLDIAWRGSMQQDFGDVRFTSSDGETQIDYWIEGFGAADDIRPQYAFHFRSQENAQYYNGKTYFIYMSTDYDVMISYYNHSTETWATQVKIDDVPSGGLDSHYAPTLFIDSTGTIHAVYGIHNSSSLPMKHKKSTNIEDISAWTTLDNITSGTDDPTYPKAIVDDDDKIWMFYRNSTTYKESYKTSTDNGSTWSSTTNIIDMGSDSTYTAAIRFGNETPTQSIHVLWHRYDKTDLVHEDVWYAYSNDGGSTWYAKDGTNLGAVVTSGETSARIVTGQDYFTTDIRLTSDNKPLITYYRPSAGGTYFIYHNGTSWQTVLISSNVTSPSKLRKISDTSYEIIGNAGGAGIKKYTSTDSGVTWSAGTDVFDDAQTPGMFPLIVEDYPDENSLVYLWHSGVYAQGFTQNFNEHMNNADIWVEVPSIPISPGTITIYMYWGNDAVNTTSDGDNTFSFYDSGESGTPSSKWTGSGTGTVTYEASPYYSIYGDNSIVMDDNDTGAVYIATSTTISPNLGTARVKYVYTQRDSTNSVQSVAGDTVATTIQHINTGPYQGNIEYYDGTSYIPLSGDYEYEPAVMTVVDMPCKATTPNITVTSLTRNEDAYIYKDFGAAYFNGDFDMSVDFKITAITNNGYMALWALKNAINDINNAEDTLLVYAYLSAGSYTMVAQERNGAVNTNSGNYVYTLNTQYYARIKRNESVGTYGTLYFDIYGSAASRDAETSALGNLTVTLTEKQDFRYLYGVNSLNTGNATLTISGVISNLTTVSESASYEDLSTYTETDPNARYTRNMSSFNMSVNKGDTTYQDVVRSGMSDINRIRFYPDNSAASGVEKIYIDNVIIAKCVDPEPTYGLGSTQSQGGVFRQINSPINSSINRGF